MNPFRKHLKNCKLIKPHKKTDMQNISVFFNSIYFSIEIIEQRPIQEPRQINRQPDRNQQLGK